MPSLFSHHLLKDPGYNVAYWRDGEVVYELVTDLDEVDIRRLLMDRVQSVPSPGSAPLNIQPATLER